MKHKGKRVCVGKPLPTIAHQPPFFLHACRRGRSVDHQRGFSLIELVSVIIIIGVLAAIAVPRYIALGRDARVAAVNTMAATLSSTEANVHAMCKLDPSCDYSSSGQTITIGGRLAYVDYGWLYFWTFAGVDGLTWINYTGFTPTAPGPSATILFALDGSPDPSTCSVTFVGAYITGPTGPSITTATSGC